MIRRHLALVATLLLTPGAAQACRCAARSPAALARAADAVAIVDVTGLDDRDPAARAYRMTVLRSWKTPLPAAIVVRSATTTCRADFVPGRRRLVYLERAGRGYRTDRCMGDLPVAAAAAAIPTLGPPARAR